MQKIKPKSQTEKRIDALALKEGGGANWFVAVDEPKEEDYKINDGDYWAKINDSVAKNLLGVYRWSGKEKKWLEAYNIKEVSVEGGVGVFVNDAKNAERFNDYSSEALEKASGEYSHAEGRRTAPSGVGSHAEGYETTANGPYSHAEGGRTVTEKIYSHAEGRGTTASAEAAHAEGSFTTANGPHSHAEGWRTKATESSAHVGGEGSRAMIANSFVHGYYLIAKGVKNQVVFGRSNEIATDAIFLIGNGSTSLIVDSDGEQVSAAPSTCFKILLDGSVWTAGSYQTDGGDYAEPYEWEDKNPENEDRAGLFVTLNGDKLRLATSEDTYILGAVSAVPSVLGKAYSNHWKGKYKKDIFERPILDEDGNKILSEDYDATQKYVPRRLRAEQAPVGTNGQLIVIDDGTCEINGYCGVAEGGIGTKCDDLEKVYRGLAFRVIERLDDTHIRIVIK